MVRMCLKNGKISEDKTVLLYVLRGERYIQEFYDGESIVH
jgi:hypothetical protein